MNHTRITDTAAMWVRNALNQCAATEKVDWDIAFQLIPTQQGPQPGVSLILRMPSPVLGQLITHIVLIGLGDVSAPSIEQFVRGGIEAIRQERSKMLGAAQPANGSGRIVLP